MKTEDRFNMLFKELPDGPEKEKLRKTLIDIENKYREMGFKPW